MTTGATGQLGLALPVQGELSGTWGDTVNNGITQYTNIAIAGTLTLTGDGAVTLANTTGDASASNITSTLAGAGTVTAQFAIVKVSGTTTTKVVTGPSYSKTYVVDNASSYAVTFKASGQTGVSIAAAEKVTVVFNGTDYIKLAGTIANAAGSNTQIQFNNGGLFGASANLTWDGTTLSSTQVNITGQGTLRLQDTTGGEYVGLRSPSALGASYTLTFPADDGTSGQALITDGSGVLSWSTAASGDVYGPASSTDNAVARFDSTTGKLLQNSVVLIGDTGAVTGVTDLTASGSVTLSGGTANGVAYLNGSKVVTSGSALTFDGSILTNTTGAIRASGATVPSAGAGLELLYGASGAGISTLLSYDRGAGAYKPMWLDGSYQAYFVSGSEQMRLTSTGLGIGTSSPAVNLNVYKNTYGEVARFEATSLVGYLTVKNGAVTNILGSDSNAGISWVGSSTNHPLILRTNDITRATIDTSGNLGLGVTPSAWFANSKAIDIGAGGAIQGRSNTAGTFELATNAFLNTSGNWIYKASSIAANLFAMSNGSYAWNIAPSGTAGNTITFTQAMTLDTSGRLGIGTTSPAVSLDVFSNTATTAPSARFYVNASGNTPSSLQGFAIYNNVSGGFVDTTLVAGNTANTYMAFGIHNGTSYSESARIAPSGNFGIGTSSPAAKLHVSGTFGSQLRLQETSGTFFDIAVGGRFDIKNNAGTTIVSIAQSGSPAGTQLNLDTSGNLSVGTTSIASSGQSSSITTSTVLAVKGSLVSHTTSAGIFEWNSNKVSIRAYGATAGTGFIAFTVGGGGGSADFEAARITSGGQALFGTPTENLSRWGRANFYYASGTSNATIALQNGTTRAAGNKYGILFADSGDESNAAVYVNQNSSGNNSADLLFGTNSGTGGAGLGNVTERMRITSTGNVGIGTTSPTVRLDVSSAITNGYTPIVRITRPSATLNDQFLGFYNGIATDAQIGRLKNSDNLLFGFNSGVSFSTSMTLDTSGNLGLGVTPSAWQTTSYKVLQVNKASIMSEDVTAVRLNQNYYVDSAYANRYIGTGYASYYAQINGAHQWQTAASGTAGAVVTFTQAMTLDASGNLMLGTTTQQGRLHVSVNGVAARFTRTNNTDQFIEISGGDGAGVSSINANYVLAMQIGGTERARIDSSGNLLVGKTATTISTVGAVQYPDGTNAYSIAGTTNSTTALQVYSTGASANRFYVGLGGTVYATSTTITAISDQRLKENIRDLDDGLSAVMALKPRKFDWKEGKGANIKDARGFIAQEFETVFPDMIEEWRDPAPEGEEAYKAINANLIPTLVKAIQEQQAIINSLKARLDAANL